MSNLFDKETESKMVLKLFNFAVEASREQLDEFKALVDREYEKGDFLRVLACIYTSDFIKDSVLEIAVPHFDEYHLEIEAGLIVTLFRRSGYYDWRQEAMSVDWSAGDWREKSKRLFKDGRDLGVDKWVQGAVVARAMCSCNFEVPNELVDWQNEVMDDLEYDEEMGAEVIDRYIEFKKLCQKLSDPDFMNELVAGRTS